MESHGESNVRRSERASKGRMLARYAGGDGEPTATEPGRSVSPTLTSVSSISRASGSSAARAKLLAARLAAEEKAAVLEEKAKQERLETALRLEKLRLEADQAQILADVEAATADANSDGTAHSEQAGRLNGSESDESPEPVQAQRHVVSAEGQPGNGSREHTAGANESIPASSVPACRQQGRGLVIASDDDGVVVLSHSQDVHVQDVGAGDCHAPDAGGDQTVAPTDTDPEATRHAVIHLQNRVAELEAELTHMEQVNWTTERVYADKLSCELEKQKKSRDCLRRKEAEVHHLQGENGKLNKLVATLQHSSQEQSIRLQQLNEQYTERRGQLEAQVEQLLSEQQLLESRIGELSDERHRLETSLEEKECELEQARSQLAVSQQAGERTATHTVEPPDKARKGDGAEEVVASAVSQLAQVLADRLAPATHGSASPHHDGAVDGLTRIVARQSSSRNLPSFSGDPSAWPMFIHAFQSSSHECGFSNQENIARLQKALHGKALDAVKAMLVVPDNIDRVIHTLEMRFGQPDHVVQTMIDGVKKMRPVREDDFEALIDLANAVGNLVATMQLMKNTGHISNPQLRAELVQKLPSSLKRQWGEFIAKTPQADVNLQVLGEWLSERADAVCRIQRICSKPLEVPQRQPANNSRKPVRRDCVCHHWPAKRQKVMRALQKARTHHCSLQKSDQEASQRQMGMGQDREQVLHLFGARPPL